MMDVNRVILLGRLGADPTLRETRKGHACAQFSVATSRKIKSQTEDQGEALKEETQWHRVVSFGKQGELCAQYLKKGQPVYIEGTLLTRFFEGKDGVEKMMVEILADRVSFLPFGNIAALNNAAAASAHPN